MASRSFWLPAYAATRQQDGSIEVKINEFRDPELLEQDLAALPTFGQPIRPPVPEEALSGTALRERAPARIG